MHSLRLHFEPFPKRPHHLKHFLRRFIMSQTPPHRTLICNALVLKKVLRQVKFVFINFFGIFVEEPCGNSSWLLIIFNCQPDILTFALVMVQDCSVKVFTAASLQTADHFIVYRWVHHVTYSIMSVDVRIIYRPYPEMSTKRLQICVKIMHVFEGFSVL